MKILENMCIDLKKLNYTYKNKSEDCDEMYNSNVSDGFSY